uniref:Uncharacterized protein n=1 Tax=Oryza punctata TaxID=4537 RepID=A0A0E0K9D3_ORYPU
MNPAALGLADCCC